MKKTDYVLAGWFAVLLLSFLADSSALSFMNKISFSFLDYIMRWFGHYASILFVLLILTSLFLWREKKGKWIKPLWLSFFAAVIMTYAVKLIFARSRPDALVILIWQTSIIDYSFPSMHAASAFAPLAVLDKEFPLFKWFWLGFALLVAFSRLYFGVHYLSDIVAGAFVGYFTGRFFVSRTEKKKTKKLKVKKRMK